MGLYRYPIVFAQQIITNFSICQFFKKKLPIKDKNILSQIEEKKLSNHSFPFSIVSPSKSILSRLGLLESFNPDGEYRFFECLIFHQRNFDHRNLNKKQKNIWTYETYDA